MTAVNLEGSQVPPTWMLRTDKIRPGDVLLSFGRDKISKMIVERSGPQELRDITKGYSHAALCLNNVMTYESDGDPIGTRPIYPYAINLMSMESYGFAPANLPRFQLFRHPHMPHLSSFALSDEFKKAEWVLMQETFGGDYSKLQRVTINADTDAFQKWFLNNYAKWADKRARDKVPTVFCSEVVAKFFMGLRMPLFRDKRPPERTTPNDLADPRSSLLEPVGGAVVSWPPKTEYSLINQKKNLIWITYPPKTEQTGVRKSAEDLAREQRVHSKQMDSNEKIIIELALSAKFSAIAAKVTVEIKDDIVYLRGKIESLKKSKDVESYVRSVLKFEQIVNEITIR